MRACLGFEDERGQDHRCGTVIPSGSRCTPCQRAQWRSRNHTRDQVPVRIYSSAAWQALAAAVVAAADRCAWCGTSKALVKLTAGHVLSIHDAPARALDPSNVAASCRSCQERAKREPDPSKWPEWARTPQVRRW